ncbi:hypothetical protein [Persicirhabdus sediminis]|uniref:Uncharacterized protein n=1 Tax=Persicirhabdus sediminis TaxID=454144 RepID=A0A8J7SHS3_9BACT|nr:hypothetical protein [Persicirhabdus sediminis]MBK1789986.1 hypothetical protein [Persicirhabdus sediminis]
MNALIVTIVSLVLGCFVMPVDAGELNPRFQILLEMTKVCGAERVNTEVEKLLGEDSSDIFIAKGQQQEIIRIWYLGGWGSILYEIRQNNNGVFEGKRIIIQRVDEAPKISKDDKLLRLAVEKAVYPLLNEPFPIKSKDEEPSIYKRNESVLIIERVDRVGNYTWCVRSPWHLSKKKESEKGRLTAYLQNVFGELY